MDNFKGKLEKTIIYVISFLLIALVLVVSSIALMRNLFRFTPQWGESLALLIMVWFCLLSAALGVSKDIHIRMTIIENFMNEKQLKILDHISNILWIILGILALIKGIELTGLSSTNIITGIGLPASVIYVAIPIFGFLVMLTSLIREVKLCKQA